MKRVGTKPVAASDDVPASAMVIWARGDERKCVSAALSLLWGSRASNGKSDFCGSGVVVGFVSGVILGDGQDDAVSERDCDQRGGVEEGHAAVAGGARAIGRGTARRGEPQTGQTETSLPVSLRRRSCQVFFW